MSKPKILLIEDEQYRYDEYLENAKGFDITWAKSADEGIALLDKEPWAMISIDHDLDPEQYARERWGDKNGQHICREIRRRELNIKCPIIIHSLNTECAAKMIDILGTRYRGRAHYVPFAWRLFDPGSPPSIRFNFDNLP